MIRPPVRSFEWLELRARLEPSLHIVVPIEGTPVVRVVAESLGDEARLVDWLQHTDAVRDLGAAVADVLDQLDDGRAA